MSMQKKLSAVAAAAALTFAAGSTLAAPFPDFTVDPDLTPGTNNSFVADKITGNYVEVITFGAANQFNFALRYVAGQFVANDGTSPLPSGGIGGTQLGNTYNLYALVTGSGTYTQAGGTTTFNTAAGGTLQFYYDSFGGTQTFFTNNGAAITDQASLFARTGNGDDLMLLAPGAGAVSGQGTLVQGTPTCNSAGTTGINCGSFGQTSTLSLSADGRRFFTSPVPFYNVAFNSGQLNNFAVSSTQVINGSLDVVFNRVPEPASLALVGAALLGLGYARRRIARK